MNKEIKQRMPVPRKAQLHPKGHTKPKSLELHMTQAHFPRHQETPQIQTQCCHDCHRDRH